MASFVFDNAVKLWMQADMDLLVVTCKVALLTTSSSVLSSRSATSLAGIATLGELSATNYVGGPGGAGRKTVASPTITVDSATHRVMFDIPDQSWSTLGSGYAGSPVAGALLYQHVSGADDAQNIPIAWTDEGGFPYFPSGATFNFRTASTGFFFINAGDN